MFHGENVDVDVETYFPRGSFYINKLKSEIVNSKQEYSNVSIEFLKKLEKNIIKNYNITY